MARIPETELERLKREISIVSLVEASGVTLRCPVRVSGEGFRAELLIDFPSNLPSAPHREQLSFPT